MSLLLFSRCIIGLRLTRIKNKTLLKVDTGPITALSPGMKMSFHFGAMTRLKGCLSHLRKRHQLSDLKESSGIEENADVVMLLYRDEYYDKDTESKNILECNIAKQRGGKTGNIRLRWIGEFQRIEDVDNNC
jgi:hypothetical protein